MGRGRGWGWWKSSPLISILPSLESLWPSLQDEVYFIRGGTAGGLWPYQTWSPSIIFPRTGNQVKTATINNFLRLRSKTTHKQLLCIILSRRFSFIPERSWKTSIFTQKWLDYLLLMTSYLVSIVTDHLQTCVKMRAGDKRTAIENLRFRSFIV